MNAVVGVGFSVGAEKREPETETESQREEERERDGERRREGGRERVPRNLRGVVLHRVLAVRCPVEQRNHTPRRPVQQRRLNPLSAHRHRWRRGAREVREHVAHGLLPPERVRDACRRERGTA